MVVETCHVCPQIVVPVVDTTAGVKVDINMGDLRREGGAIIIDLDSFGKINLGTVGTAYGWHLFDAVYMYKAESMQ